MLCRKVQKNNQLFVDYLFDYLFFTLLKNPVFTRLSRAIDGTRTRGFHLGKVALYQLSHYRIKKIFPYGQIIIYYKLPRMSTTKIKSFCFYFFLFLWR